ncbi:MAG: hypothetical protein ACKO46_03615 [Alphaproteobacteria bacterium]
MFFPIRSYILAIIIYFFAIFLVSKNINSSANYPEISIEIDAEMLGDKNIYEQNSRFNEGSQKIYSENLENKINSHQHLNDFKKNDSVKSGKTNENINSQKIAPIFQPLPEIPEDLRYQIFSTAITAKFYINEEGEVYEVELVNPSNIPKLNMLLIKSLKRWKFPKNTEKFTQIINVEFKVEN